MAEENFEKKFGEQVKKNIRYNIFFDTPEPISKAQHEMIESFIQPVSSYITDIVTGRKKPEDIMKDWKERQAIVHALTPSSKVVIDNNVRQILEWVDQFGQGLRILDVGTHGGNYANILSKKNKVIGFDLPLVVMTLKKGYNFTSVGGDCENMQYFKDDYFDVLIVSNILDHLENPDVLLKDCKRILREDGILIIYVPIAGWPPCDYVHTQEYDKERVEKMLKIEGFEVLEYKYFDDIKGMMFRCSCNKTHGGVL